MPRASELRAVLFLQLRHSITPIRLIFEYYSSRPLTYREVMSRFNHNMEVMFRKLKKDPTLFFGMVLILLLFLPLLANFDFHLQETELEASYRNNYSLVAAACSLSLCIPLFIDIISDAVFLPKGFEGYLSLRSVSLLGMVIYDVAFLSSYHMLNFAMLMENLRYVQIGIEIVMGFYLMKLLDDKGCWTNQLFTSTLTSFIFITFWLKFFDYMQIFSSNIFTLFISIFGFLVYLGGLYLIGKWLLTIMKQRKAKSSHDSFIFVIILNWLSFSVLNSIFDHTLNCSSVGYRVADIILRTLYTFVIVFIPARIIRQDAFDRHLAEIQDRITSEKVQLEELLRLKQTFVRHVSHEIRYAYPSLFEICIVSYIYNSTPLNTVLQGIELLRSRLEKHVNLTHEFNEDLEAIEQSCRIAIDILSELLTYEKLESGLIILERSVVFAFQCIKLALAPFRIHAVNKGVLLNISFDCDEHDDSNYLELCKISVDVSKFSQVIRNLCSNAIKFTPAGGKVGVSCSLPLVEEGQKRVLKLVFKDSGCGISPSNMGKLFGEGVQFDAAKNQGGGGSGIGLWISKQIIELHGGSIWATSEGEGRGCEFHLEVPTLEGEENNLIKTTAVLKPSISLTGKTLHSVARVSPYESSRFLLVDDSAAARKMTNRLLTSRGHDCSEADDGLAAIAMCRESILTQTPYDVIIMDNFMPNCNGAEATKAIRALGFAGVIVGVTGSTSKDEIDEFHHQGADLVLPKPIDIKTLLSAINEQSGHQ